MKRGLLLNLGLSLGVTVLLIVGLEATARLVEGRRKPPLPVAEYIWNWDSLMPGGFYVAKSDAAGWPPWEEINGDGLRDRTRPHEKADGVRRVAVLGDSVTLGAGIRADEAYPQRLEARLRREGRPIEVMNVALWGWSTRQQRIAWQRIVRAYRPDAAILAVCLNDIPELHNNLDRPPSWLAWLHERSAVVRAAVNAEGREIDSVERLFTSPEARSVRQALELFFEELRELRREIEGDGASFGVIVFPFRFQVEPGAPVPVVQERIAAFCRAEGVHCLDLLPLLSKIGPTAFVDYDHLSPRGAEAVVEAALENGLVPGSEAAPDRLERALAKERGAGAANAVAWLTAQTGRLTPAGALALAALLSSRDAPLRLAAAWALEMAAVDALPARDAVAKALRHDASTGVRGATAAVLGAMASREGVPLLFDALGDPSEVVRHEAARALARIETGPQDVARLTSSLESPDDYVSAFAAWTLGNLGEAAREAVPALALALARERTDAVVAAALARIGPAAAAAVPPLVEALRNPDADRRWRAARTLGRIGPAAEVAVPALSAALDDENGAVRQHAARALGRIGGAALGAAPALQRATGDRDEAVRREARQALERLH